jgi:hypothetical protein
MRQSCAIHALVLPAGRRLGRVEWLDGHIWPDAASSWLVAGLAGLVSDAAGRIARIGDSTSRENTMLIRKTGNLAVAGITTIAAVLLTALGATSASATATADANSGPAHMAGYDVPAATSTATFKIRQYDGLCLDISGEKADSPAVQFVCNAPDPDRTWHWGNANAAGFRQLKDAGEQCLGVAGGSTKYEAQVVAWSCNGHPDQYWYPIASDLGGLQNYHSNLFLTVDHGSTKNGAGIVQWGWRGYTNQLWFYFR